MAPSAEGTTLITGFKANAGVSVTYQALGASAGWTYIPVKAYVEAIVDASDRGAWRQAITDTKANYTGKVTYTYASKADTSKFLSTEVYFYGASEANPASPTTPATFDKSSQIQASADGAKVEFSVSAKNLINTYEGTEETHNSTLLLGYIVVRAGGFLCNQIVQ